MVKFNNKSGKWLVDWDLHDAKTIATDNGQITTPELKTEQLLETAKERIERKRSHIMGYFTMVVIFTGLSISQNALWPYLREIENDVSLTAFGWVVTINPLGQIILNPVLGYWSNKINSVRIPNMICILVFILGNLIYATLYAFEDFNNNTAYFMMLAARFFIGISIGSTTLTRSHIAMSTTLKERTSVLAINFASQAAGLMIGPGIQALFTVIIPTRLESGIPGIVLNQYTASGWLAAFLGIINLFCFMPRYFQEHHIAATEYNINQSSREISKPNYMGAICQAIASGFFIIVPSISETLATPMVIDQYGIPDDDALFAVSIVISAVGLISIIVLMTVSKFAKKYDERKILLLLGFVPLVISFALHYPIGNKPIKIANCTLEDTNTIQRYDSRGINDLNYRGMFRNLSNLVTQEIRDPNTIINNANNNVTYDDGCYGCPYLSQPWCLYTPQITPPQLIVSYLLARTSYVIGLSFSQAIFTKILGPRPLGLWMSLLSSISAAVRIICPIWLSYVYENFGTTIVYTILICIELVGTLIILLAYKQLIPMPMNKRENSEHGIDNVITAVEQ